MVDEGAHSSSSFKTLFIPNGLSLDEEYGKKQSISLTISCPGNFPMWLSFHPGHISPLFRSGCENPPLLGLMIYICSGSS